MSKIRTPLIGLSRSFLVVVSCSRWAFATDTTWDMPSVYTRAFTWSSVSLLGPAFVAMILSALSDSGGRWQASRSESYFVRFFVSRHVVLPEEVIILSNHVFSGCFSWFTSTRRSPVGPSKVATTASWAVSAMVPVRLKEAESFNCWSLRSCSGWEVGECGKECDMGECLADR